MPSRSTRGLGQPRPQRLAEQPRPRARKHQQPKRGRHPAGQVDGVGGVRRRGGQRTAYAHEAGTGARGRSPPRPARGRRAGPRCGHGSPGRRAAASGRGRRTRLAIHASPHRPRRTNARSRRRRAFSRGRCRAPGSSASDRRADVRGVAARRGSGQRATGRRRGGRRGARAAAGLVAAPAEVQRRPGPPRSSRWRLAPARRAAARPGRPDAGRTGDPRPPPSARGRDGPAPGRWRSAPAPRAPGRVDRWRSTAAAARAAGHPGGSGRHCRPRR